MNAFIEKENGPTPFVTEEKPACRQEQQRTFGKALELLTIPRDFACDVREKVLSARYTFVVLFGTVWGSVHLPCHGMFLKMTCGRC